MRDAARWAVLSALVTMLSSCEVATHEVEYKVDGASSQALLTMITGSGTEQITTALPWSRKLKASSGQFLYLSVSDLGGGRVTCRILWDGKDWTSHTGRSGHATCSGPAGGEANRNQASDGSDEAEDAPAEEPIADKQPPSSWTYRQSTDAMTDKVTQFACVRSNGPVHLGWPYGSPYAELCLRDSPRLGKDAIVSLTDDGQILCRSYDGCTVSVRFDGAPVQGFSAEAPSDGSSNVIFISNRSRFENALRKAERVIIEAEFYQAGNQQMTFNTAGLEFPQP